MPTATAPNHPQKPCTEIAPHGSSILRMRSWSNTPQQTINPAMIPIIEDEVVETKAHGAVFATSPASFLLHVIVLSGLHNLDHQNFLPDADPNLAERFVLIEPTEILRS